MAITVKHSKVSLIPDGDDTSIVRPSDWNDDHVLTGTIPVANGGTGASTLTGYVKGNGTAAMTASATIPNTDITGLGTASTKDVGAANGVATLDAGGKVPVSELPAAVLGALSYQGTWDASTNTPTLTSSVGTKGYYYVVSVAGNTNLNGITDWLVGDWAVYNGSIWQKVDNTDAGGDVVGPASATDNAIARFDSTTGKLLQNSVVLVGDTGAVTGVTTLAASTSVTTPIVQASNSGGLALRNSAGTTQISMGAGGGDNVSINVATNINGANAQIDISPTGTGHVHIKPTGTGSLEIAPTNAGTINNVVIGGTTPLAITGTTITATSFVGSGASLTNVVNSLAASTGISVSGSTGAVTVTNTAPDQTVVLTGGTGISTSGTYPSFTVTNTAPDQTVAIASGTGISVSGTYPNFTVTNTAPSSGGTVTSVTGTSPVVSSGGNTPAISLAANYGDTQNPYASKTANNFLAAPNGSAGAPTFRAIVAADIPTLNQNTTGSAATLTTARNLWGQSFNGSADISAPLYPASGSVSLPAYSVSGDTNTGIFFPAADTIAFTEGGVESMRIDSSANVGIGVTPSAFGSGFKALQMNGGSLMAFGGTNMYYLNNTFFDGTNYKYVNTGFATNYVQSSGIHTWSTAASGTAGATATLSEVMRIDSAGNCGIGTSSPSYKLEVTGNVRLGPAGNDTYIAFGANQDNYFTCGNSGVQVFRISNGTERMRIDSDGNLLVGTTTTTGRTTSFSLAGFNPATNITGAAFSATGSYGGGFASIDGTQGYVMWSQNSGADFYIRRATTTTGVTGGVYISNAAGSWSAASDERLKNIIRPIENAVEKLKDYRCVIGEYKDNEGAERPFLIAQDVEKTFPEAVNVMDKENGYLGLSYTELTPLLVKAIQELNAKVTALETQLGAK